MDDVSSTSQQSALQLDQNPVFIERESTLWFCGEVTASDQHSGTPKLPPLAASFPGPELRDKCWSLISGGTPWATQRDVRIQKRATSCTQHRHFALPRTGRETVDLQLHSRRTNGFEPEQQMVRKQSHNRSSLIEINVCAVRMNSRNTRSRNCAAE